MAMIMKTDVF